MKNQYFGDINDYRKYGLLRCLWEAAHLPLGVCWLLTSDDGRTDGEFRSYLRQPTRWRRYDPDLFDRLRQLLDTGARRDVAEADRWRLLPEARYFERILTDDRVSRAQYFDEALARLQSCPLIFFDPDNGIEVKSVSRGARGSAKYLYISEAEAAYRRGHSLVIYQHFPRMPRAAFTRSVAESLMRTLGASAVDSFATAHVVFFLIARPEHAGAFRNAHALIQARWAGQIVPLAHVGEP